MATLHYLNAARKTYETDAPIANDFYSVEIKIDDADYLYQFKLWKTPADPSFVLVKQESGIMKWIHPGDILPMTFYSDNLACPRKQLQTRILNIHRQDDGRFRGHYVVKLGIIEN
jgi:hypothetical protein